MSLCPLAQLHSLGPSSLESRYKKFILRGTNALVMSRKASSRNLQRTSTPRLVQCKFFSAFSNLITVNSNESETVVSRSSNPYGDRASDTPRRIVIFVEPSPFTYVSGYKNRFTNMIKYLMEAGCRVLVVTTGKGFTIPGVDVSGFREQPERYGGAEVISALSVGCPYYPAVPLSFALSPRIWRKVSEFQPDLVHCSSPGAMVFAAKLYAWLLKAPVVLSYHTHVPSYLPRYGAHWLVAPFWAFLKALHATSHLTLATSPAMRDELVANGAASASQVEVWKKGVDSEAFHHRFRSLEMRRRLTGGRPEKPVAIYVGRLGYEKNLFFLKEVFSRLGDSVTLAFVGSGPARAELEREFKDLDVRFLGVLHGEALSAAYASADIFVMPSESETLGFVVLEAMASQMPVVAVRAGGIPDIIRPSMNGIIGFLYEQGDVEGATLKIKILIEDQELRQKVGVRAREEVAKWDWKAATEHLLYYQYPLAVRALKGSVIADVESSGNGVVNKDVSYAVNS